MDLRDCQRMAGLRARLQSSPTDPLQTGQQLIEVLRSIEREGAGSQVRHPQMLKTLQAELTQIVLQAAELANGYGLDLAESVEEHRLDFFRQNPDLLEIEWRPAVPERIEKVTVYAASSPKALPVFIEAAEEMGRLLALQGWSVVYGGGNIGLMGALNRGARSKNGRVIAVILDRFIARQVSPDEVPDMKTVSTMRSRKRGLEEAGDAFICLPGGFGTLEEVFETISFRHLGFHHKPIIFCNVDGFWDEQLRQLDRCFEARVIPESSRMVYQVAATPAEAVEMLKAWERPASYAVSQASELQQGRQA